MKQCTLCNTICKPAGIFNSRCSHCSYEVMKDLEVETLEGLVSRKVIILADERIKRFKSVPWSK